MSETLHLSAEAREQVGKGASRVLRRAGRTPAVVYGGNLEPLAVHLEEKALKKMQLGMAQAEALLKLRKAKVPSACLLVCSMFGLALLVCCFRFLV